MTGITDIHNHILYQVDDGADSIETTMTLLQKEYDQGVRNVILTPHYHIGACMPDTRTIQEHFQKILEETQKKIPHLNLYLGNEIMACNDIIEMLQSKKVFTLAESRYVLIEFYPSVSYSGMERYVSNLLNNGYIPIIAHCERYKCLREMFQVIKGSAIRHLVEMGAYLQVNVTSVYGKDKKFVAKLIEKDYLHLVASDAHDLEHRNIFWEECIKYLEKKYNKEYIEWLLIKNPKKILSSEYI